MQDDPCGDDLQQRLRATFGEVLQAHFCGPATAAAQANPPAGSPEKRISILLLDRAFVVADHLQGRESDLPPFCHVVFCFCGRLQRVRVGHSRFDPGVCSSFE